MRTQASWGWIAQRESGGAGTLAQTLSSEHTHTTHCARSEGRGGKPSRASNTTQSWSLGSLFAKDPVCKLNAWVLQTPALETTVVRSLNTAFVGLYPQTLSWPAQTFRSQGKKQRLAEKIWEEVSRCRGWANKPLWFVQFFHFSAHL